MYGFEKYWTFVFPLLFTLFITVQNKNLEIGETCKCQSKFCTCLEFSDCDVLIESREISYCNRRKGIVCCPEEEVITFQPKLRSELACEKFTNLITKECPRNFIAGGSKASSKEFPPAALIGFFEEETNSTIWFCGGTLISERFVLTASHCAGSGDPNIVRLGDLDYSTTEDDVGLQEFSVSRVIPHGRYDAANYYDIMLLELAGTVNFTEYVQPACILTPKLMDYNTGVFWAVGWGSVDSSGIMSKHLRRVELKQMENCSEIANKTLSLERGLQERTQFCAHGKIYDTCKGDSGGPLLATFPHYETTYKCLYIVAGVVSRGQVDCGKYDYPSLNTNVTAFIRYIENYVWPETS
ncbi:unnamed protein product [Ceratitis capitata]|uniref:(Mediterranean fruit fly) hypothetical protein n=1 Tax=Ceratitis capitata TaxID=7213 RepID=A0A811UCG7_CERCA|nr:unnamed protein product [Ceratitis capitata]